MKDKLPRFPPGRVAIFNGSGVPFEFALRELPFIKPGEILVRTIYTTLCGSDIHTYSGRRLEHPHVVLGHEIIGDVLWIDPSDSGKDLNGEKIKIGDRITWSIFSVPEGTVSPRSDIPQKSNPIFKYGHAPANGDDLFNGGLADYCILRPFTAFIKISKSIPVKVAATISCAHSTVMGAVRVAEKISGKRILVFGSGLLGLSCLAICKEAGAAWIGVTDIDSTRLKWAEKFGTANLYLFNPEKNTPLPWPEVDLVFDMTGNPYAMKMGIDSLALGGSVIWVGAVYPAAPVEVDAEKIVRRLLQIRGLHNYNYEDLKNATSFIENNYHRYPFEDLVEKEYLLEEIEEAFAFASKEKPVRVGINIIAKPL